MRIVGWVIIGVMAGFGAGAAIAQLIDQSQVTAPIAPVLAPSTVNGSVRADVPGGPLRVPTTSVVDNGGVPTPGTGKHIPPRPNRGDAQNCLIDRQLRLMDPKSPWLPENGYRFSSPPDVFPCEGAAP